MKLIDNFKDDMYSLHYIRKNHAIRVVDYYKLVTTSIQILNYLVEDIINDFYLQYSKDMYSEEAINPYGYSDENKIAIVKCKDKSKGDPFYEESLSYEYRWENPLIACLQSNSYSIECPIPPFQEKSFLENHNIPTENIETYRKIYYYLNGIQFFQIFEKLDIKGYINYTPYSLIAPIFHYDEDTNRYVLDKDAVTLSSTADILENEELKYYCIKLPDEKEKRKKYLNNYKELRKICEDYRIDNGYGFSLLTEDELKFNKEKKKINNKLFFQKDSKDIRNMFYHDNVISHYDLSDIDFDGVNVSRINFSKNLEVKLNMNKIIKDLYKTNLEGYSLKKTILTDFNLQEANLKGTYAGIDLATCKISLPGKSSSGTQFDQNNTFYFGNEKVDEETLVKLKIKRS